MVAVPLAVFLILLLIYVWTLLPTMVDQDSGELVAAVHVQGIPHPTGYPLWLLLGRAFDYLPVGHTSAYRVALASAVPTAAAGAVVSLLALGLTAQPAIAATAGLAFGLWFPCWSQAVRAEVYGLTALLFALALLALRRWNRERSSRALVWMCLACGFVSMHHRTAFLAAAPAFLAALLLTPPRCRGAYVALAWMAVAGLVVSRQSHVGMVVVAAALAALVVYGWARRSCLRVYVAAISVFLAPFVLYLYLWLRALHHPAMNWTNPTTLDRLIYHALGKQYFGLALSHTPEQMAAEAAKLLPQVLTPVPAYSLILALAGLPLIVWGWAAWRRREPVVAWSLAAGCGLLCFWVLQWGETSDLKVFLSPLGAVLAVCGGLGLAELAARIPRAGARWGALGALGLALCAIQLGANWRRADLSNVWEHRDRWHAVLSQVAPNAIFVSDFDIPGFATLYLQNVEGYRRDVTLLRAQRLADDWYVELIADEEVRREVRRFSFPPAYRTEGEFRDETARFAYTLAKRLPGRAIYALHAPLVSSLPGPPHFVGISEDLMKLELEPPDLLRPRSPRPALAEFPLGLSLMGLTVDRAEAGTGEMVGFTAEWRLGSPLVRAQFAVGLVPEGMDLARFAQVRWKEQRQVQGFPVANAQWGLGPSPEGTVYAQRGEIIVPTNAKPGSYTLAVGIGPLYAETYQNWAAAGRIEVRARPRPRNGP